MEASRRLAATRKQRFGLVDSCGFQKSNLLEKQGPVLKARGPNRGPHSRRSTELTPPAARAFRREASLGHSFLGRPSVGFD